MAMAELEDDFLRDAHDLFSPFYGRINVAHLMIQLKRQRWQMSFITRPRDFENDSACNHRSYCQTIRHNERQLCHWSLLMHACMQEDISSPFISLQEYVMAMAELEEYFLRDALWKDQRCAFNDSVKTTKVANVVYNTSM